MFPWPKTLNKKMIFYLENLWLVFPYHNQQKQGTHSLTVHHKLYFIIFLLVCSADLNFCSLFSIHTENDFLTFLLHMHLCILFSLYAFNEKLLLSVCNDKHNFLIYIWSFCDDARNKTILILYHLFCRAQIFDIKYGTMATKCKSRTRWG